MKLYMKTTYQLTWEWNWIWHIKENLNQNMFTSELYISLHNLSSTRNEKISALIALFLINFSSHFSTSEFRSAFLKTIRQIIRESVRNMSLPALDTLRKPEPPQRSESTKLSSQMSTDSRSPIGEFQEANFATQDRPHFSEDTNDPALASQDKLLIAS